MSQAQVSKTYLLNLALKIGLLQSVAPFCRNDSLDIYLRKDGDSTLFNMCQTLFLRWDGKTLALAPALELQKGDAGLVLLSYLRASKFLVELVNGGGASLAFAVGWCRWMYKNQTRLFSRNQVCRVERPGVTIHLLCISVWHLCRLVRGVYVWHMYWKSKISYFYLALGCDTPIIEALLHGQPHSAAIFHFVELLLSRGFTWNEYLLDLGDGLSKAGVYQSSVFIETPFHQRTYHPIATLDLAVIRDIVDLKC